MLFQDRVDAGRQLAAALQAYANRPDVIVVAVPVASPETCDEFRSEADEIVCVTTPEPFYAVGMWYQDFSQTTDEEVRSLLDRARREQPVT